MSSTTSTGGRIDPADHHDPAWHIHGVAHDFELIDAWRLPVVGGPEDFAEFMTMFLTLDLATNEQSTASNLLFAARTKLGEVFGWDDEVLTLPIPGCEETSLSDRLSPELRALVDGVDDSQSEFRLVYQTDDESVVELSNSTVHAAVHFAWVATEGASHIGQMGIYVKTRGRFGGAYMIAIAPFRHYIVYPALMRRLESAWKQRPSPTPDPKDD